MCFAPIYGKVERKVDAFCADLWKVERKVDEECDEIRKKAQIRPEMGW